MSKVDHIITILSRCGYALCQQKQPKSASMPLMLKVLKYELFHFYPVKENITNISFAPIGLLDMFNNSGVVEQFEKPELFDGEVSSKVTTSLSNNRSPTAIIIFKAKVLYIVAKCIQRCLQTFITHRNFISIGVVRSSLFKILFWGSSLWQY
ncbi:Glycosyl hydrolases 36 - like 2 [Theobroma cacao]|nr:Glycosyl hydrolases 36 - like 2 [Theobroma cacao]